MFRIFKYNFDPFSASNPSVADIGVAQPREDTWTQRNLALDTGTQVFCKWTIGSNQCNRWNVLLYLLYRKQEFACFKKGAVWAQFRIRSSAEYGCGLRGDIISREISQFNEQLLSFYGWLMLYLQNSVEFQQRIRAYNIRFNEIESVCKLIDHSVIYISKKIQIL